MATMASKADVEASNGAEADPVAVEGNVRSVTEVDVRRSVAEGVVVLAEVEDWICDAAYSLDRGFSLSSEMDAVIVLQRA